MTYIGLDPGRSAGIARLWPDARRIVAIGMRWDDDPRAMTDRATAVIGADAPALSVIEDQHVGAGHRSSIVTAQTAGAMGWWHRVQWPAVTLVWLHPSDARRLVGCGPAKSDVAPWLESVAADGWAVELNAKGKACGDAADACVLAYAAMVVAQHNEGR